MELSPSIRGKIDLANDPFALIAADKGESGRTGGIYLLLQVDYNDGTDNYSEAILCSEFTGALQYPYVSGNDKGHQYFTWGVKSGGTLPSNIIFSSNPITNLYNHKAGNASYVITDIFPLKLVYENNFLFSYVNSQDKRPLFVETGGPGDDFSYRVMIGKSDTDPSKTSFGITPANNFFASGYAGYPYLLTAENVEEMPFRNFQFYSSGSGELTEIKMTYFNINQNPNKNVWNSLYRADIPANTNFLNMNEFMNFSGKDILMFKGIVPSTTSPSINPENLPRTTDIYFLPNTYYPSNFNLNDISGVCAPIGTNKELTAILNYFYFQWASGFPGTVKGGTITKCAAGFLNPGDPTPNVCGWTSIAECQRAYYYDYCEGSATCSNCYGSCGNNQFCDINSSFTAKYKVDTPFVCGSTPEPQKKTDWKEVLIIGSIVGGSVIILVVLLILFFSKKKSAPVVPDFENE